ncbi:MAG TPA: hypothetical protein VIX86_19830 [Streptosporangiaceae bacterium]
MLIFLLFAAKVPLDSATWWAGTGSGANLAAFIAVLPTALLGFVVARRQPGNPLGWMFLALMALLVLADGGGDYAWLSYRLGHHLPLAVVGVFLAPAWVWLLVTLPLMILLFPDGRLPSPRWRPVLWAYLAVAACWPVSIYAVTIRAVAAGDIHLAPGGDLRAVDNPAGSSAWLGPVEAVIVLVLAVFWLAFAASQVRAWRRADGDRRQQLKWLASGGAVCMAGLAVIAIVGTLGPQTLGPQGSPPPAFQAVLDVATIGLAALPVSIGVAILRYRLYDIDRIISRTLAYAIVTGLLVGVYAGLVLLATRVLSFHTPLAVAAATLAAAALFNPLRRRVQRAVDRRFNRARYNADQMVAAFAARIQDAAALDSVRDDLAGVVYQALEPAHVSVWISERA